jgi:hypothetical protein
LASKTAAVASSESSVGSSSEANSPVSIRPAESKRSLVDPLDEMGNFDFKESSDPSCQNGGSEENFDCASNYTEEDFTDLYEGVSYGSEDEWMPGLELHDDEPTIFSRSQVFHLVHC